MRLPNSAGLPNQNDTTYCPYNQSSCYVWVSAGTTFDAVASKCSAAGGYLASYSTASEQLQVGWDGVGVGWGGGGGGGGAASCSRTVAEGLAASILVNCTPGETFTAERALR